MASVATRLEQLEKLFKGKNVWITGTEARDEQGYDIEPDEPEAVQFCLLGGAKHVGNGKKLLTALAQAIDKDFTVRARHADWHGETETTFRLGRDCAGGCSFDADETITDIITEYNDGTAATAADIRLVIRKAKKLVAK